jgi:hypothetical protein
MVLLANQEPYVVVVPSDSRLDMHKARTALRNPLFPHMQQQQQGALVMSFGPHHLHQKTTSNQHLGSEILKQQLLSESHYGDCCYHPQKQHRQGSRPSAPAAAVLPEAVQMTLQQQQQQQQGRRRGGEQCQAQQRMHMVVRRRPIGSPPALMSRCQAAMTRLVI